MGETFLEFVAQYIFDVSVHLYLFAARLADIWIRPDFVFTNNKSQLRQPLNLYQTIQVLVFLHRVRKPQKQVLFGILHHPGFHDLKVAQGWNLVLIGLFFIDFYTFSVNCYFYNFRVFLSRYLLNGKAMPVFTHAVVPGNLQCLSILCSRKHTLHLIIGGGIGCAQHSHHLLALQIALLVGFDPLYFDIIILSYGLEGVFQHAKVLWHVHQLGQHKFNPIALA